MPERVEPDGGQVIELLNVTSEPVSGPEVPEKIFLYHHRALGWRVKRFGEDASSFADEISQILANLGLSTFCARLQKDSATEISLQRFNGKGVVINGEFVDLGGSGFILSNTSNLIDSTGLDSGDAPESDTKYFVYVSGDGASFSPNSIRLSETTYSVKDGIRYLGTSGNAENWRFAGFVQLIDNAGTPNFVDSEKQRFIINYYNRRALQMEIVPGYVDNNTPTTIALPPTDGYVLVNGGVDARLEYLDCGEDAISVHGYSALAVGDSEALFCVTAYGIDSVVNSAKHYDQTYDGAGLPLTYEHQQFHDNPKLAEGYHSLNFLFWNSDPTKTATLYIDGGRAPHETVDEKCTWLMATIYG